MQFWSGETNHCSVPTCTSVAVTLPLFETVTVSVKDTETTPQAEIPVYAFDGTTYKEFTVTTDTSGLASFTLPTGNYRFRADVHSHQYWSGTENHCTTPGCTTAEVTTPRFGQVTVTVQYRDGEKLPNLPVYAFNAETYSGISGTTDTVGQVQLWLPEGNYRFRADQNELPFWSGQTDHCAVPGCETVTLSTYATGSDPRRNQVITYTYDGLNRLTAADYDTGAYYHYTYDVVGNRLQEATKTNSMLPELINTYEYDAANRLVKENETNFTWDANGNLLSDGVNTYSYDSANRLVGIVNEKDSSTFVYNGMGDRVRKTANGVETRYTLDLNSNLTQVLADGTNTYLYGPSAGSGQASRISQENATSVDYFLGDAIGNVRQMISGDAEIDVVLAREYLPYGEIAMHSGNGKTDYGFTGEMKAGGLVHYRDDS